MNNFIINGIYDLRTLKSLQEVGINCFSFNFDPKSYSFIQEYKFLELIKNSSITGKVFLFFKNNEDYFIDKLILDLTSCGFLVENIIFIFENVTTNILNFNYAFCTYYNTLNLNLINKSSKLITLIFKQDELNDLYNKNLLDRFYRNLLYNFQDKPDLQLALEINWNSSIATSLVDLFEFNIFIFNIESNVEICYRNVDLVKLKNELKIKNKELNF